MRRDNYDPENATQSEWPDDSSSGNSGSQVQERASEAMDKTREQATAVKDRAKEQTEMGKQKAASGLHSAAEQMRNRTTEQEGARAQAMTKAADTMDKSAQYLEEHEPREMWEDFERFVKDHPMQAAAGALVAGVIVGRILR